MALCPSGHESQTTDYCDTCGALMGGPAVTPAAAAPAPSPAVGGASAAGGASGAGPSGDTCPLCGSARSGRFCEEDGYDFELAALVPPGAVPVPDPPLTPPPGAYEPLAETAQLGPDFDLEAELAAAERAAAAESDPAAATLVAEAPAPAPDPGVPGSLAAVVIADLDYYTAQVQRGDIIESEFPFPRYPGERRFALETGLVRIGRASASRGIAVEIDLTGPPLDPAVSHLHAQLLRAPDGSWAVVDLNSANGTRLNGAEDPIPAETEVPVKAGDRIHLGVWTTIALEEA